MAAYASSVGGITTPIGTTTNVMAMGLFRQDGYFRPQCQFPELDGTRDPDHDRPLCPALLVVRWYSRGLRLDTSGVRAQLREMQTKLGPWKRGEINTCIIFAAALTCWTLPGIVGLIHYEAGDRLVKFMPEELIAVLIPVALYLLPIRPGSGQGTLVATT